MCVGRIKGMERQRNNIWWIFKYLCKDLATDNLATLR